MPTGLLVPQQSWVGTGPCCIVKGEGWLCLVSPRNGAKQGIFRGRPHCERHPTRRPAGLKHGFWIRLRFGRRNPGKRQRASAGKDFDRDEAAPDVHPTDEIPAAAAATRPEPWPGAAMAPKPGDCHQTRQELTGTIGWPFAQPNALPNSSKFSTEPFTRQRPGEWESISANRRAVSSVWFWHHTWAKPRK